MLFVADIATACCFYTEKLGFSVAFTYGDPPFYAQVFRDAARLNLRCVPLPVVDPQRRDREHLLSACITLEDAEPLFLELEAAGLAFHQPLKTEPWGAKTFILRDPDGNLILFAGRTRVGRPLAQHTVPRSAATPVEWPTLNGDGEQCTR